MYLSLNLTKRLVLFGCLYVVGIFLVGVLTHIIGIDTTPKARILTVMQDIFIFIMPAIVTALMVTRQPATLLDLDYKPEARFTIYAVCCLIAGIPALDVVVTLNNEMPLPDGLAQVMRQLEDTAAGTISLLRGGHTIPDLIMSILIVGIMAGVSEEIFFRGGLQRLLVTGGVNVHLAIWITAAVFSLMHMQIYGFVPRMLLGAFLGYSLYWSRCLWVPMILHTLNNTIYLISDYLYGTGDMQQQWTATGIATDIISLVLTVVLLRVLYTWRRQPDQIDS